jgi:hypothetical protein
MEPSALSFYTGHRRLRVVSGLASAFAEWYLRGDRLTVWQSDSGGTVMPDRCQLTGDQRGTELGRDVGVTAAPR